MRLLLSMFIFLLLSVQAFAGSCVISGEVAVGIQNIALCGTMINFQFTANAAGVYRVENLDYKTIGEVVFVYGENCSEINSGGAGASSAQFIVDKPGTYTLAMYADVMIDTVTASIAITYVGAAESLRGGTCSSSTPLLSGHSYSATSSPSIIHASYTPTQDEYATFQCKDAAASLKLEIYQSDESNFCYSNQTLVAQANRNAFTIKMLKGKYYMVAFYNLSGKIITFTTSKELTQPSIPYLMRHIPSLTYKFMELPFELDLNKYFACADGKPIVYKVSTNTTTSTSYPFSWRQDFFSTEISGSVLKINATNSGTGYFSVNTYSSDGIPGDSSSFYLGHDYDEFSALNATRLGSISLQKGESEKLNLSYYFSADDANLPITYEILPDTNHVLIERSGDILTFSYIKPGITRVLIRGTDRVGQTDTSSIVITTLSSETLEVVGTLPDFELTVGDTLRMDMDTIFRHKEGYNVNYTSEIIGDGALQFYTGVETLEFVAEKAGDCVLRLIAQGEQASRSVTAKVSVRRDGPYLIKSQNSSNFIDVSSYVDSSIIVLSHYSADYRNLKLDYEVSAETPTSSNDYYIDADLKVEGDTLIIYTPANAKDKHSKLYVTAKNSEGKTLTYPLYVSYGWLPVSSATPNITRIVPAGLDKDTLYLSHYLTNPNGSSLYIPDYDFPYGDVEPYLQGDKLILTRLRKDIKQSYVELLPYDDAAVANGYSVQYYFETEQCVYPQMSVIPTQVIDGDKYVDIDLRDYISYAGNLDDLTHNERYEPLTDNYGTVQKIDTWTYRFLPHSNGFFTYQFGLQLIRNGCGQYSLPFNIHFDVRKMADNTAPVVVEDIKNVLVATGVGKEIDLTRYFSDDAGVISYRLYCFNENASRYNESFTRLYSGWLTAGAKYRLYAFDGQGLYAFQDFTVTECTVPKWNTTGKRLFTMTDANPKLVIDLHDYALSPNSESEYLDSCQADASFRYRIEGHLLYVDAYKYGISHINLYERNQCGTSDAIRFSINSFVTKNCGEVINTRPLPRLYLDLGTQSKPINLNDYFTETYGKPLQFDVLWGERRVFELKDSMLTLKGAIQGTFHVPVRAYNSAWVQYETSITLTVGVPENTALFASTLDTVHLYVGQKDTVRIFELFPPLVPVYYFCEIGDPKILKHTDYYLKGQPVTALSAGVTTVTVSNSFGTFDSVVYVVKDSVPDIVGFYAASVTMKPGALLPIPLYAAPVDMPLSKVTLTSSDSTRVDIVHNMLVALSEGEVTITARAGSASAEMTVYVTAHAVAAQSVQVTLAPLNGFENIFVPTVSVLPVGALTPGLTLTLDPSPSAELANGLVAFTAPGSADISVGNGSTNLAKASATSVNRAPQCTAVPLQTDVRNQIFRPIYLSQYISDDYTPFVNMKWEIVQAKNISVQIQDGVVYPRLNAPSWVGRDTVSIAATDAHGATCQLKIAFQVDSVFALTVGTPFVTAADSIDIQIYPNPVSEHLSVNVGSLANAAVTLSDLHGKTIFVMQTEQGMNTFDLSLVPAGLYILAVENDLFRKYFTLTVE